MGIVECVVVDGVAEEQRKRREGMVIGMKGVWNHEECRTFISKSDAARG